ncbi:MAG: hypothetical protein KatS3mg039_0745 [Candidatus Kapaibacterium sp.]|nr:MAG: hypothetical protein KatS3mg039_0745 [Candidatus Kapabacteria bacterium]
MIEYLSDHPHLVVLVVTIVIWSGIALYLWRLGRRIVELEKIATQRRPSDSSSRSASSPST